jgi:putative hydrolase of the HAD superfamily
MSTVRIRGVLLDAGGVLIRPRGGRWNPRYDFEGIVLARHPDIAADRFPDAFAAGQRVLDESPVTVGRAVYHRAILAALGIDDPDLLPQLEASAAGPTCRVRAAGPPQLHTPFLELYPDVRPTLDDLESKGIGMAVVSDSWAGLDDMLADLGIAHYFAGIVISEVLGCRKPDPRMYEAGRAHLGLDRAECLFVDDDPELVAAARALGYRGVTLTRDGATAGAITTLDRLRRLDPAQDLAGDDLGRLLM